MEPRNETINSVEKLENIDLASLTWEWNGPGGDGSDTNESRRTVRTTFSATTHAKVRFSGQILNLEGRREKENYFNGDIVFTNEDLLLFDLTKPGDDGKISFGIRFYDAISKVSTSIENTTPIKGAGIAMYRRVIDFLAKTAQEEGRKFTHKVTRDQNRGLSRNKWLNIFRDMLVTKNGYEVTTGPGSEAYSYEKTYTS